MIKRKLKNKRRKAWKRKLKRKSILKRWTDANSWKPYESGKSAKSNTKTHTNKEEKSGSKEKEYTSLSETDLGEPKLLRTGEKEEKETTVKTWTLQDELGDVKKGDRVTLECGHSGRIVWISSNRNSICVRGVSRRCQVCGKPTSGGWVPTCYLISTDKKREGGRFQT